MARPRKTVADKKIYRLIVRLNEDERKQVEQAARRLGLRAYAFARVKVLESKVPKPVVSGIELDVYLELKKIGVNINQLARVANSGKFPTGIIAALDKLRLQQEVIIKSLTGDREPEGR